MLISLKPAPSPPQATPWFHLPEPKSSTSCFITLSFIHYIIQSPNPIRSTNKLYTDFDYFLLPLPHWSNHHHFLLRLLQYSSKYSLCFHFCLPYGGPSTGKPEHYHTVEVKSHPFLAQSNPNNYPSLRVKAKILTQPPQPYITCHEVSTMCNLLSTAIETHQALQICEIRNNNHLLSKFLSAHTLIKCVFIIYLVFSFCLLDININNKKLRKFHLIRNNRKSVLETCFMPSCVYFIDL